ncbi:MAG TPA: ANTAR domain-containing protein [Actinospica sp.]|nr:ANTAR domain-containing protein [Actinospica sp.]
MARVLQLLDGGPQRRGAVESAAVQAAEALGVDGLCAGLGTGSTGMVLSWGCETVSARLEELQFTLGEGPGPDAAAGAPVLAADLTAMRAHWPAFASEAAALGVRAVFAWPLRIGAISVGTLIAHRATAGPLAEEALADAYALAEAVTLVMLHQQYPTAGLPPQHDQASPATYRAEVHQAVGMISVQLGVGLAEALARLRAYAYSAERPINEVAALVVARSLRFNELDP